MKDLIAKIEELKKSLAAMKPKSASSTSHTLVPALEAPLTKPVSPRSSAISKPKLPGISPSSNKDPKKMAEQLKNPRPKKPKIEILKVDENGQWSLEKFGENNSV